jgi:hypothetical protein
MTLRPNSLNNYIRLLAERNGFQQRVQVDVGMSTLAYSVCCTKLVSLNILYGNMCRYTFHHAATSDSHTTIGSTKLSYG